MASVNFSLPNPKLSSTPPNISWAMGSTSLIIAACCLEGSLLEALHFFTAAVSFFVLAFSSNTWMPRSSNCAASCFVSFGVGLNFGASLFCLGASVEASVFGASPEPCARSSVFFLGAAADFALPAAFFAGGRSPSRPPALGALADALLLSADPITPSCSEASFAPLTFFDTAAGASALSTPSLGAANGVASGGGTPAATSSAGGRCTSSAAAAAATGAAAAQTRSVDTGGSSSGLAGAAAP
mmetsp:Transcript_22643/g.77375  ORF Transcript_22643/g.77375 Transcript_22643/m.77375 type:complete len:242 (+) Transcript_22643:208-933(+)